MFESLTSLRGIFAFMIFLSHVGLFAAGGDSGVTFFMMLSGVMMTMGYGEPVLEHKITTMALMKRRLLRLYPLHLTGLVLALVLLGAGGSMTGIVPVICNLLLIQSWFPVSEIYFSCNTVSWFMSDLMFCYLLFPAIIRLTRLSPVRQSAWLCLIIVIYLGVISLIPARLDIALIYVNPLLRLPDFIIGVYLWHICRQFKSHTREVKIGRMPTIMAEVALLILTVIWFLTAPCLSSRYTLDCWWWPVSVSVIGIAVLADGRGEITGRILRSRLLVEFGKLSFPFYMIHWILIEFGYRILNHFSVTLSAAIYVPVIFIISTVAAWFISYLPFFKKSR